MKPALPKIAPAKRKVVPPEPEFTSQEALKLVRLLVIALVVPLVYEIVAWFTPTQTNLAAACVRSGMQWVLTHGLHEGNRDVYLAREGWLFSHAEINRLVHAKRENNETQARLTALASRLKTQETSLLVVLIPGRAALYPEQIRDGRYTGPVRLKEENATVSELKAAGIDVMDMTDALWEFRDRQQVFFAQDSHWTPEAMKAVALAVNKQVREKFPRLASTETPIINATIQEQVDSGDLSRRLDPLNAARLLGDEGADLISIQGIEPSAKSPIVLHGGEWLRVFDDPQLSFGGGGESPRAGFATQLGMLFGRPVDVRGMPQAGEGYEDKKLVIWLLPMTELVP